MTQRVLIVDDEPDLLELVRHHLDQAGYDVSTCTSGRAALESIRHSRPDLVVLDLMLPDLAGTEICRKIRSDPQLADVPILMLTAKGEEVDRVVGFELGADDYVAKPFSPRELTLRVSAILRRTQGGERPAAVLGKHGIELDTERHRCQVDGVAVDLTAKEFRLLTTLIGRPGRVMNRQTLLEEVWGSDINVTERTIDTHMKRLREKLGVSGDRIETVRGVGYRFAE